MGLCGQTFRSIEMKAWTQASYLHFNDLAKQIKFAGKIKWGALSAVWPNLTNNFWPSHEKDLNITEQAQHGRQFQLHGI